ncbi:tRNA (adenosine(37)-N6)-dimethylallyltransferase MiaA, partial [Psychromonas aquatilis]
MKDPVSKTLPNAILLMGPTASGKSDLAIILAQQCRCDI